MSEREGAPSEQQAAGLLVSELHSAWQRGWQPLDVHRTVSQILTKRHLTVLACAIADEMRCYPRETVDPRWRDQLAEIDALPGDRAAPGRLGRLSLHRTHRGEWLQRVREVTCVVRSLPPVQLLMPPPGSGPVRTRSAAEAVDDRVLRKVRAMLAKAESTQYAEEAEAYTAAAQRMMTRYRIDSAMLEVSGARTTEGPAGRRIGVETPYESAKVTLLCAVAQANGCRTVWHKSLSFCTLVGTSADLDLVERLFTSLLLQAATAVSHLGARSETGSHARSRSFKRSFLTGYAVRIGERLTEASRSEVQEAGARPGGAELVPLLAARGREVDRAVETLFPSLRPARSRVSSLDADGWASGRGAADAARLGVATGSAIPG